MSTDEGNRVSAEMIEASLGTLHATPVRQDQGEIEFPSSPDKDKAYAGYLTTLLAVRLQGFEDMPPVIVARVVTGLGIHYDREIADVLINAVKGAADAEALPDGEVELAREVANLKGQLRRANDGLERSKKEADIGRKALRKLLERIASINYHSSTGEDEAKESLGQIEMEDHYPG